MVNWTKPAQDQAREHSNEVEDWAHEALSLPGNYCDLKITEECSNIFMGMDSNRLPRFLHDLRYSSIAASERKFTRLHMEDRRKLREEHGLKELKRSWSSRRVWEGSK